MTGPKDTEDFLLIPLMDSPKTELAMRPGGGQADEVAQESFPDDLGQSSEFDPTESEPVLLTVPVDPDSAPRAR